MISIVILVILSLAIGVAAFLLFLWAGKRDQFNDIEGPKYRMLDDDDDDDDDDGQQDKRDTK